MAPMAASAPRMLIATDSRPELTAWRCPSIERACWEAVHRAGSSEGALIFLPVLIRFVAVSIELLACSTAISARSNAVLIPSITCPPARQAWGGAWAPLLMHGLCESLVLHGGRIRRDIGTPVQVPVTKTTSGQTGPPGRRG